MLGGQRYSRARTHPGAGSLILLSLAVFGLALSQLGADSCWYDEAWTWTAAHNWLDAEPMFPISVSYDTHPPTYYRMVSIWMGWLGGGEFAVRLLSAISFILAIPAGYMTAVSCTPTGPGCTQPPFA